MRWLLAACGSCLLFIAAVQATFVPLQNPEGVEYFFAAPPVDAVLRPWLLCVVVLTVLFMTVRGAARVQSPQVFGEASSGRWLAPVAAVGVVVLGLVPAVPGVGEHGSIVGFGLYDLRWWWAITLAAIAVWRADRLVGTPLRRAALGIAGWSPAARLLALDTLMFVGVITWALATTTNGFNNGLGGDEPKYVRYDEVWYQGHGLDVSDLVLVSDQPLDERPQLLHNGTLLIKTIPNEIGAAVTDLRNFVRDPAHFRWNRAAAYNGFVDGIHGGLYEQYSPGMSVFLFPGYFIDRYLLNVSASQDGKWPADLTMTKMMMLLTYGICAVMLFRLLRNALESDVLASIWAGVAMLTLPTTAFAFQMYPELPALLVILAVSNELLFGSRTGWLAAGIAGAATGALGWIHVRFLLIAVCLAAFAFVGKSGRARWAFSAAFSFVVFSIMIFNYHVTGSWWPTALWDANGMGVSFGMPFVRNFIGYAFDRRWGLLPHSLVLVGALPGLLVLGLTSRRHAAFVAVVVVGLVAASAGHTLIGAATTPDRLILAVTPLLIWPVAILVRRFWFSSIMRIVTVSFAVVSLDSGRAYNWVDAKSFGLLRDVSLSGWKPNLGFADIRGETWDVSRANFVLLLCQMALVAGLSWLAVTRARRPRQSDGPETGPVDSATLATGRYAGVVASITVAALIACFSVATSANGDWSHWLYLPEDGTARAAATRAVVSADRCFCFTSARGHVDWSSLSPNSARSALIDMFPDSLRMTVLLLVQGDGKSPAFGRMRVEFGDGEQTAWTGVLSERRIEHRYERPGTYQVRVWFQLPARVAPQLHTQTVEVHSAS